MLAIRIPQVRNEQRLARRMWKLAFLSGYKIAHIPNVRAGSRVSKNGTIAVSTRVMVASKSELR